MSSFCASVYIFVYVCVLGSK